MIASSHATEPEFSANPRMTDAEAFQELCQQLFDSMKRTAVKIVRNEHDAEDAVQDAFLAAWRSIDRFTGGSSLRTWIHRIVINASLMKLRMLKRHSTISMYEKSNPDETELQVEDTCCESPLDGMIRFETTEQLHECIAELPEQYRRIVMLRDVEELDTVETASRLNLTSGAVKTRLCRARRELRNLMECCA